MGRLERHHSVKAPSAQYRVRAIMLHASGSVVKLGATLPSYPQLGDARDVPQPPQVSQRPEGIRRRTLCEHLAFAEITQSQNVNCENVWRKKKTPLKPLDPKARNEDRIEQCPRQLCNGTDAGVSGALADVPYVERQHFIWLNFQLRFNPRAERL
jgi:hypothetical protein